MIKILMHGSNGKMGQVICGLVAQRMDAEIVAGIDVSNKPCTFPVFADIEECDMPADVIIDFSFAGAVSKLAGYAADKKIPVVICTTGLSDETINVIKAAAEKTPVFMSANMSLGVNLIVNLAKKAAATLFSAGFDIEIIEKHHNLKLDAPSGTALLLGNAINSAIGNQGDFIYDRTNERKRRNTNEIGIHSIRGGTIVGEHTALFAGKDEIVEIKHSAVSKEIFAVGAIKAAFFIVDKNPGLYDMEDLIEL